MDEAKDYWNSVYDDFEGNQLSVWREEATPFLVDQLDFLKENDVRTVLDAGCGDGRNLLVLAKAQFEIIGVDFSESALECCRELCNKYDNVKFKNDTLEKLDFDNESFDAVICDLVFIHMREIEKVISNFHRVLKPNGYVIFEFPSIEDRQCNKGEQIGENKYLQDGLFIRTFTEQNVKDLLTSFKILKFYSVSYTDPSHGNGYHRTGRHEHHSHFILAQKL